MSSPLSLNVTGLETETLIQELMKVERQPVVVLEAKQKTINDRKTAWNTLKTKLDALLSKMKPLLERDIYYAKTVKVGNPDVISVSASSQALPSAYDIEVVSLAKAHVLQSESFSEEPDEVLARTGTLSLTLSQREDQIHIQVEETDSLNSIAAKINEIQDSGVTASIFEVAPSDYRLVLTASSTNERIIVNEGSLLGFSTVVSQCPAQFKIKGIEFQRDSNHISDAIPHMSFNLLKTGETSITFGYDDEALIAGFRNFVDEYNGLLDTAAKLSSWDSDTKTGGTLFGDPLLQRLLNGLRQSLFKEITGKHPGFSFVGAIGLSTGSVGSYSRDGKLVLDEAKLKEALIENREGVVSLLRENEAGSEGILVNLRQSVQMFAGHDGLLPLRKDQLESQNKDISRQIENLERRLQMRLANLRKQFTALESLMMQMNSQGVWLAQQVGSMLGS